MKHHHLSLIPALHLCSVCGCTSCVLVDAANGDVFSYRTAPWEDSHAEEAAARVRYWCGEGPKHYAADRTLRLDMTFTLDGTNVIKTSRYIFNGTKKDALP